MAIGRKTALYMRLSSDDGGVNESDSIVHQRQILTQYAKDHGFPNIMEFVDDGYSGADFNNRPQFQRMLQFDLCASGLGPAKIARIFTTEGIPTPYEEKGASTGGTAKYHSRWSEATIARMLERKEYIGHTENKKTYVLSYKNKKRIFNDLTVQTSNYGKSSATTER